MERERAGEGARRGDGEGRAVRRRPKEDETEEEGRELTLEVLEEICHGLTLVLEQERLGRRASAGSSWRHGQAGKRGGRAGNSQVELR